MGLRSARSEAVIKAGNIIAVGIVFIAGIAAGTVMAVSRQLAGQPV